MCFSQIEQVYSLSAEQMVTKNTEIISHVFSILQQEFEIPKDRWYFLSVIVIGFGKTHLIALIFNLLHHRRKLALQIIVIHFFFQF